MPLHPVIGGRSCRAPIGRRGRAADRPGCPRAARPVRLGRLFPKAMPVIRPRPGIEQTTSKAPVRFEDWSKRSSSASSTLPSWRLTCARRVLDWCLNRVRVWFPIQRHIVHTGWEIPAQRHARDKQLNDTGRRSVVVTGGLHAPVSITPIRLPCGPRAVAIDNIGQLCPLFEPKGGQRYARPDL